MGEEKAMGARKRKEREKELRVIKGDGSAKEGDNYTKEAREFKEKESQSGRGQM